MRTDDLYLVDILEAGDRLRSHLHGITREELHRSMLHYRATLAELIVMGEACTRMSDATKAMAPEVAWQQIRGFRNLAVHGYFALDVGKVWDIATGPVLRLCEECDRLLQSLFPDVHREFIRRRDSGEVE